ARRGARASAHSYRVRGRRTGTGRAAGSGSCGHFRQHSLARYGMPGTSDLADALTPLVPAHDAILMANHGVVTYRPDLLNAFMKMEKVEHYAKIVAVARQLGPTRPLSDEDVRKLMRVRENYEGNRLPSLKELD